MYNLYDVHSGPIGGGLRSEVITYLKVAPLHHSRIRWRLFPVNLIWSDDKIKLNENVCHVIVVAALFNCFVDIKRRKEFTESYS